MRSLHLAVDLLGEFVGRHHHDAVDRIFGIAAVVYHADYWQQVGRRLAGSCLGAGYHVAAVEYVTY